jgi:hypothetical protein
MKRIANTGLGLTLFLGLLANTAGAQDQAPAPPQPQSAPGSSLGDYARQVRKDGGPKAKPKVFDNDNMPREDKLSIVGTAQPIPPAISGAAEKSTESNPAPPAADKSASDNKADAEKAAMAARAATPAAKPGDNDQAAREAAWKQWQQKISALRDQVELLTRESDVLQREYQIRAAAFYADAGNRLRNSGNWDKEDTQYKQQIADKQKALEDAKQKIEDAEEDARKAGVPAAMREP